MRPMTAFVTAIFCLTGAPAAPAAAAAAEPLTLEAAQRLVADAERPADDRELDDSRDPARALNFMQVEAGDRALDMFAGRGYYTELLAAAVGPEGRVIAQNPAAFASRDTIKTMIAARGFGDRLANAGSMNVDFMDMRLAPGSLDMVLFHLVYHDLYFVSDEFGIPRSKPQQVLAELHRALRPGGSITVIDHVGDGEDARADVEATHRIRPDIVKRDFRQAGFKLAAEETWFDNPDDDHGQSVFVDGVRGKTDRFAMRFVKAGDPNAVEGVEPPPATDMADGGACDASQAEALIGKIPTESLEQQALAASGAATLRSYTEGDMITQDYRPDRLNIVLDPDDGTVMALRCG